MKPYHKIGMRHAAVLVAIIVMALCVMGCGKKGDPIPKNPFKAGIQDDGTHTIL